MMDHGGGTSILTQRRSSGNNTTGTSILTQHRSSGNNTTHVTLI